MQLKFTIVVFAAALCAVQATSLEEHHRNKRTIESIINKASSTVENLVTKIKSTGTAAVDKIMNAAEVLEDKALDVAAAALKVAGVNIDIRTLHGFLKGEIQSCATTEESKKKVVEIRDSLMSCLTDDINAIKEIYTDVKDLIEIAKEAPALIQDAADKCLNSEGGLFGISRVTECASAVKSVITSDKFTTVPLKIVSSATRATKLAAKANVTGYSTCISAKAALQSVKIASLAASFGSCMKSSVTGIKGTLVLAKAAPQLAVLTTGLRATSLLG